VLLAVRLVCTEAEIGLWRFVRSEPSPTKKEADTVPLEVIFPSNTAGPILVNVLLPDTVKDPLIITSLLEVIKVLPSYHSDSDVRSTLKVLPSPLVN
jgi:hypothetical protein